MRGNRNRFACVGFFRIIFLFLFVSFLLFLLPPLPLFSSKNVCAGATGGRIARRDGVSALPLPRPAGRAPSEGRPSVTRVVHHPGARRAAQGKIEEYTCRAFP